MNLFGKEYNQYRKKRGGAKLRIQKMARGGGERDTKRAEKREDRTGDRETETVEHSPVGGDARGGRVGAVWRLPSSLSLRSWPASRRRLDDPEG